MPLLQVSKRNRSHRIAAEVLRELVGARIAKNPTGALNFLLACERVVPVPPGHMIMQTQAAHCDLHHWVHEVHAALFGRGRAGTTTQARSEYAAQGLVFLEQVRQAVELLHRLGFAHRDVKTANVLLFGPGNTRARWSAKLCDFSMICSSEPAPRPARTAVVGERVHDSAARKHPPDKAPDDVLGDVLSDVLTRSYRPPEFVAARAGQANVDYCDKALDYWGVGCIAYEYFTFKWLVRDSRTSHTLRTYERWFVQQEPHPVGKRFLALSAPVFDWNAAQRSAWSAYFGKCMCASPTRRMSLCAPPHGPRSIRAAARRVLANLPGLCAPPAASLPPPLDTALLRRRFPWTRALPTESTGHQAKQHLRALRRECVRCVGRTQARRLCADLCSLFKGRDMMFSTIVSALRGASAVLRACSSAPLLDSLMNFMSARAALLS